MFWRNGLNELIEDYVGQSIQEWTTWYLWKTAFKKFEVVSSAYADHITSQFLKAVFHRFHLDTLSCFWYHLTLLWSYIIRYLSSWQRCFFSIYSSEFKKAGINRVSIGVQVICVYLFLFYFTEKIPKFSSWRENFCKCLLWNKVHVSYKLHLQKITDLLAL